MHNPSQPLPFKGDTAAAVTPRDIVAFTELSLRWAAKGPRVAARGVATALDTALHPDVVFVALEDPTSGETMTVVDGAQAKGAPLSVDQWRVALAPLLQPDAAGKSHVLPHPLQNGKLRVLIARIGVERERTNGYIVLAAADPAFPSERDELLLRVASHQVALAVENHRGAAEDPVEHGSATDDTEFRAMYEHAPIGVAQADTQTYRLVRCNPAFCRLVGYSADELAQMSFLELTHPDDRAASELAFSRLLSGDTNVYEVEERYRRKDGGFMWAHATVTLIPGQPPHACRSLVFVHDITARKQAQLTARLAHAQLQLLADNMPALVAYVDRERTYRFANRCYQDWFGYAPEQVVGRHVVDILGADAYARVRVAIERALAGETVTYEADVAYKDGQVQVVYGSYVPDRDEHGAVRGFFAWVQDITQRKAAERALRQSEERHRTLLGLLPAAVYTCDATGCITYYNQQAAALWGREPTLHDTDQRFCGAFRLWLTDGRVLPHDETPMAQAFAHGTRARNEEVIIERPDGSRVVVSVNIDPLYDEAGRRVGAINVFQDVTENKRAVQALRESEERFRRLADTAPVLIWMTDEHKRSVYFNKRWLEFTGQSFEQALAEDWLPFVHADDRGQCADRCLAAFEAQTPFTMDFRMRRHDGSYRWMSDTALPRYDADGTFRGFIGTMIDITERKQIEDNHARMLETERTTRAEAELLRDLGLALNSELGIEALVQRVTDAATAAVGAEFGAFFYNLTNAEGESYTLYTLSGAPREAFERFPLPRNTGLFGPTFRGEGVVRCDDVKQDPRYGHSEPYRGMPAGHLPVTSYLAVPVRSRSGEVLGGLFFGHAQPARFEARHERIVGAIAAQAAVAIDNARLFDAMSDQAQRLRIAYEQAPLGICQIDERGRVRAVNERFCQIVGYASEELLGRTFFEEMDIDTAPSDAQRLRQVIAGEVDSCELEQRYRRKDGRAIWGRLSVAMARDGGGKPSYSVGILEDVTARRMAEERSRFLAEASKRLAASLDYKETLADVATLAVPAVADWCTIDLVNPHGVLEPLALAHADPAQRQAAHELRRRYPPKTDAVRGPAHVIRTGQAEWVTDITDDMLAQAAVDAEHLALLRALKLRSYVCVPLAARDRVLGTITFAQAESERRFEDADVAFVEELTRRIAGAIDNALLFDAVREQAERLKITHEQAPIGIAEMDLDACLREVNDRFCRILGRTPVELLARNIIDILQPNDAAPESERVAAVLSGAVPSHQRELGCLHKDGHLVWVRLSIGMLRDGTGTPRGALAMIEDITARHSAEERARFLAEASKRLAASLDYRETLGDVANLAVPVIADWCTVDILEPDGTLARVAVAPANPDVAERATAYRRRYPPLPQADRGPYQVLRARRTELIPRVTEEVVARLGQDEAHRQALRELGVTSYLCTPLIARERVLGTITFVQLGSARYFEEPDIAFVEELARRAALAIDNALLFDAARTQAERLQATYDHAPIGIAEASLDGKFLGVNDRFCSITGYTREELLSRGFLDLTHPDDVVPSEAPYRELIAGKTDSYRLEKRYLRKDGRVVWVHLTVSLVHGADGSPQYGIGAIEDITERRRAEIVISGQKKALEQMAHGEPLTTVLETLVGTFDRQSTARGTAAILLLAPGGDYLRPATVGRLPEPWVKAVQKVSVGEEMALCGRAVHLGTSVFVPDIAADPRWERARALALSVGFRAAWSFCLRSSSEQVVGTFAVFYGEPREPTADELRFIPLITDTAALAIERYRNEQSLQDQAEVLRQIHDAVVTIDVDGYVRQWNEGAVRLFGFAADETIGHHLSLLCPTPSDYAWLERQLIAPVKRDGRLERVTPLRRRDGEVVYAHVSMSLLRGEDGNARAMVAYVLDVTARVHAERELAARVRQQETVARLGQSALSGTGLQEVMDQAVHLVAETLEVELCKVLELQPDGRMLLLRAGVGWREGLVGKGTVSAGPESQAGFTLASSDPVVVTDLRNETRFSGPPLLHEHAVISGMSVVIQGDAGKPYGVFGAHSTRARRFSAYDVNFLQAIAHIVASAIQRKHFDNAMQQARDDLERRVEERTAELARANQSLRDEVVDRMGVENALRDSEAQYRMLFERNPVPAWVFDIHTRDILAANETAVWQYGYTREEFLRMNIHDLHPPEEATRALDYAEQFPPETAYIGVWKHRKQDETIIDVEMFVYEVLFQGRWARLMLANDITERRRTEREFRLIETITRAVSEARDLDAALYAVLRHICESTGWVLGEAWLPTNEDTRLRCSRAWYCAVDGLEEFRHAAWELELRRDRGLIGRAWQSGEPVWTPDVTDDETFARREQARDVGLRAGISVPITAEGETVALLAFFLREPRLEDEHQIKLVATIATQVGLAIQRKRAEDRLRASEERFRLLVEGAHDYAIFMLDAEGCVASWNKGAERLKGYSSAEVLGRPMALFYTPDDIARELPRHALMQAATAGVHSSEGWRVRRNGERFWASATITALRDAAGKPQGFVKVTRDITERKQAEEKLRESEARLARAQEFSLLMVVHVGLDGRWLKVPPMLCATLAYREEELLAGRFEDLTHPDDFPAEWAQCERLIRGEAKSFDIEKRFLRRDGKTIWVYQNTSIVLDADDRPLHFLTFLRDITQRKEAEEQLRRSEIQLSEAQRLAHLGSWEWDVVNDRIEWSDELYRIYGVPARTPITFEVYLGMLHSKDRERVQGMIAHSLETREPFTGEERIRRPDGELRYLLSHGAVVTSPKGEAVRMVGVCLDITDRKRAEERLRDYTHRLQNLSQRLLEAQETERRHIARELHDQIGQDLSVIKINLQALQRLPGNAALTSHVEETLRIVEGVLQTARNLSVELRPSMLDDLGLVAALRWYLDRQAQRAGVALHFVMDNADIRLPPTIETACFRLAQEALTNILRHASAGHVRVALTVTDDKLEMHIEDDGKGFDVEAARARAARGESFGLLGMEERAVLAGGELEVVSAPGQGTTLTARFPLNS